MGSGKLFWKEYNMVVKIGEGGRSHVDEKVIASSREEQWMEEPGQGWKSYNCQEKWIGSS